MKFESGDTLLYVNPFIFTIEIVTVEMSVAEDQGIFWIETSGAYLAEYDLHKTLEEARQDALMKLDRFYTQKRHEIINQAPTIQED